jgi:glycosyltransferase involved in cell wall biosynthesis
MLRRSVYCFLAQTHIGRELLVLHEERDQATADFVAGLNHPMVRHLSLPTATRLTLGAKRNLMVQAARGRYIATWDDDDWHAPTRLAEQLQAIRQSGHPACVLKHLVVCDTRTGQAWLSQGRNWDQTVLCEREAMPPYADLDVAEDVPCISELANRGDLVSLASPNLYVYAYHGGNAGTLAHFKDNVFSQGTRLDASLSQRIAQLLAAPHGKPLSLTEVLAARMAA